MNYNIKQKVKNASMAIVLLSMIFQVFVPFLNVYADEFDPVECVAMQETVNGETLEIVGGKNANLDFSLRFALTSQNTDGNSEIIIEDEFDEALDIKTAIVKNKAGDTLDNLTAEIDGQKVTLKLKPEDKNTWLDRELEVVVKAGFSNQAELDEVYENNFSIIMDGKRYKSNNVKTGYVEKIQLGDVNKEVKAINDEGANITYEADYTLPTESELKELNTEINKIRITDEYVIQSEAIYEYDNIKVMIGSEDVTGDLIISTVEDRLQFDLPKSMINDNLGETLYINYDLVLKGDYDVTTPIYNESALTNESSITKDILFEAGYYDTKGGLAIQVDNEFNLDIYYQDETGLNSNRLSSRATAVVDNDYDRMINIPVEKAWKDEAVIADKLKEEIPNIVVDLSNEGNSLSKVTLSEGNNWKAEFENIPLSEINDLNVTEETNSEYIYSYINGNYIDGYLVENRWNSPNLDVTKRAKGFNHNATIELSTREIGYTVHFDMPTDFEPFELDELTLIDTIENDVFEIDLSTIKFSKGVDELNDFDYTTEVQGKSVIFNIDNAMVEEYKGDRLKLEYTLKVKDEFYNFTDDNLRGALSTNAIVNEADLVLSVKGVGGESNRTYYDRSALYYEGEDELREYDVNVTKEWIGEPADEVTLELVEGDNVLSSIILTENDDWTGQFEGVEILDSLKRNVILREVGLEDEYEVEIEGSIDGGYTLTNTELFQPGRLMNILVQKEWIGLGEDSVTINLYADNVEIDSIVLNEGNKWEHTFTDLPDITKYGEEIEYTIDEETIDGYKVQINGNVEEGFIVKNTRFADTDLPVVCEYVLIEDEELLTEVTAEKVWLDAPRVKPTIELQLYRNGIAFEAPVELRDGQTQYTWDNLLIVDEDGRDYEYTVDEIEVPEDYDKTISRDGLTITNRYIGSDEELIDVTGVKVWENAPETKPTIELQLYRNGAKYGRAVELRDGETEYTWKDLPKEDEKGISYEYTINEVETPENYTKTISRDGLTVTNRYEEPIEERMNVTGNKIWENAPEVKPTIELQLYRNGEKHGGTVELRNGDTEYTWYNLLELDENGKPYDYSIDEVEVPEDYEKSISPEGLAITNRYTGTDVVEDENEDEDEIDFSTEKTEVKVEKKWDGEAQESATIHLLANGEIIESVDLSDENDWEFTFVDLLVYDEDGNEIEYMVEEEFMEGYEAEINGNPKDGFLIINRPVDGDIVADVQTYDGGVFSTIGVLILSIIAFAIASKEKMKQLK